MTERTIINGVYQCTIRVPERIMQMLEEAFKLDSMVFNRLVCDALEHFSYCPVDSPRGQLERIGTMTKELRERVRKLELQVQT